jgi:hypothetical protein|tara:strand:+ start:725 stop:1156 length:432 start_codon:yes stop_codon:yes gene_type:complete
MAKLLFIKDQNKSEGSFGLALADGESVANEWTYDVETITQEQYTQLVNGSKIINSDNGNITFVDAPICQNKEEYDQCLRALKSNLAELSCSYTYASKYHTEGFTNYVNQVNEIDSSTISFPLGTSFINDISTRCPDFVSFITK